MFKVIVMHTNSTLDEEDNPTFWVHDYEQLKMFMEICFASEYTIGISQETAREQGR